MRVACACILFLITSLHAKSLVSPAISEFIQNNSKGVEFESFVQFNNLPVQNEQNYKLLRNVLQLNSYIKMNEINFRRKRSASDENMAEESNFEQVEDEIDGKLKPLVISELIITQNISF